MSRLHTSNNNSTAEAHNLNTLLVLKIAFQTAHAFVSTEIAFTWRRSWWTGTFRLSATRRTVRCTFAILQQIVGKGKPPLWSFGFATTWKLKKWGWFFYASLLLLFPLFSDTSWRYWRLFDNANFKTLGFGNGSWRFFFWFLRVTVVGWGTGNGLFAFGGAIACRWIRSVTSCWLGWCWWWRLIVG